MRLLRFFADDGVHLGLRREQTVLDLTLAARALWKEEISSPLRFLAADPDARRVLVEQATRAGVPNSQCLRPLAGLRLDAPLRDCPKLLALAGNFRRHVQESGFPDVEPGPQITPQVFWKPPSTGINAPGGPIPIRSANVFVDWELELAVVIGRRARDVAPERAMDLVLGYTILNDVSERQFNTRMPNRQIRANDSFFDWLMGKWFDGFAPLGPELVTRDEIPDPHDLSLRLWVNDRLMQDGHTSQMILRIPETIGYISTVLTLEPGDIISMGTPEGVGMARGVKLEPGDRIRGEIEGIGVLENFVHSADGEGSKRV